MNMIELQDRLKSFSQEQLIQQMQAPDGSAPQFMVLSEITRRKRMQDDMMAQQAKQGGATVAEEVIAAAGVPQEGLPQMASAMAPKSSIAQNTGIGALPQAPQGMYAGGPVKKMAGGGPVADPAARALMAKEAAAAGMTLEEYLRSMSSGSAKQLADLDRSRALRNRMLGLEPVGDGVTFPTQADLNQRFGDSITPSFPVQSFVDVPPTMPGAVDAPNRPIVPAIDLDLAGDTSLYGGPPASPYDAIMQGAAAEEMQSVPEFGPAPPRLDRRAQFEPEGPGMGLDLLPEEVDAAYNARQRLDARKLTDILPEFDASMTPAETDAYFARQEALRPVDEAAQYTPSSDAAARGLPPEEGTDWRGLMDAALNSAVNSNPITAITGAVNSTLFGDDTEGALPPDMGLPLPKFDEEGNPLPAEVEEAPVQPVRTPQSAPVLAGGTGGTGTSGGGSGGSSGTGQAGGYISELEAALKRAEKTAEQDKWLALAQAGMALMASDEPTLGGALGEAGMVGVEGFRSARDTYENARMTLMQAINAQRAAAAKALGGGRSGGSGGAPSIEKTLKELGILADSLYIDGVDELGNETRTLMEGAEGDLQAINERKLAAIRSATGYVPSDFDATQ